MEKHLGSAAGRHRIVAATEGDRDAGSQRLCWPAADSITRSRGAGRYARRVAVERRLWAKNPIYLA
ncbi:MAG: hypothetical protein CMJ59_00540 [Planctomycetaceae bacterium]|nr:hypothetical protein [Planctomycetaceae bacterium]